MWYLHKLNARNLSEKALAIPLSVCWGLCWSQRAHRKECIHRKRKKASFLVFPHLSLSPSLSLSISFIFYFSPSCYSSPLHAGLQKEPLLPFPPHISAGASHSKHTPSEMLLLTLSHGHRQQYFVSNTNPGRKGGTRCPCCRLAVCLSAKTGELGELKPKPEEVASAPFCSGGQPA